VSNVESDPQRGKWHESYVNEFGYKRRKSGSNKDQFDTSLDGWQ